MLRNHGTLMLFYFIYSHRANYDTFKAMVEERGQSMELALSLTHTTCLAGYSKKFLAVSVCVCVWMSCKAMMLMCHLA